MGSLQVEVRWWWWCHPSPSEGWERKRTPQWLNSQAMPQGLDQRSKLKK